MDAVSENSYLSDVDKIQTTLRGIVRGVSDPFRTIDSLRKNGFNCVLLKQRKSGRKRFNFDDSYIIGVRLPDNEWIAIKIHTDKYENCRRIYKDRNVMNALIEEGDIPMIYDSFLHKGDRVTLYQWSKSPTVKYLLKKYPEKIGDITASIERRVVSLASKGFQPYALDHSDMVLRDDGSVIITDINKIQDSALVSTSDSMPITDGKTGFSIRDLFKFWKKL